jgi:AcrR family transcriptional regulator
MITRREQKRENIKDEIKTFARQQMAQEGTAALSLRAIARDMELTVTALYRYFASRDELITALIVDAFASLADALQAAADAPHNGDYIQQARNIFTAYRQWALQHPTDFELIYGNPIPAYDAPREITVPQVIRGFTIMLAALVNAVNSGQAVVRITPPASVLAHLEATIAEANYPVTSAQFYAGVRIWTRLHGAIMLELFQHLPPAIGDVDAYYRHELDAALHELMP